MRPTLALVVLFACLWAAPAAAESSLTKRNNDATLRKPHLGQRPIHRGSHTQRDDRTRHRDEKPAD